MSGEIDREQVSRYTLVVIARDRAASPRSSSSQVTIVVSDVNDELPTFGSKTDVRLDINETFQGELQDMSATDPDESSRLRYSILYDQSSGQSGTFQTLHSQDIQVGGSPTWQTWIALLFGLITTFLSVCLSVCWSVSRSVCRSVGLSVYLSVGRSVGRAVVGRSVGRWVCLSVCLSVCLKYMSILLFSPSICFWTYFNEFSTICL